MPTVLHRLGKWAEATPHAPAQSYKASGTWQNISASEFRDRVHHLALFLKSRGVDSRQVTAILGYNSPEWVQSELATLLLGAKAAGLYPNSTTKDIHYILNHTEASVLVVQNKEYFQKVTAEGRALPATIKLVVVFEGDTTFAPNTVSFTQALAEGRKLAQSGSEPGYNDLCAKLDPNAGSILIYTSGTTGNPKGALLSHDNLVYTSDMVARHWRLPFARGSIFSFLPLCHVAEQLQNVGVGISQRYQASFATKFENVATELPEVQPTLLLCVPRLWEKMMEGVQNKISRGTGAKKKLALWALEVGRKNAEAKYSGRSPGLLLSAQLKLADKLVLSKVRQALGLGKAERLASGAAALAAHISRWFRCLGLEILEDFGQTESTGVICMTEIGVEGAGTVGKPVPGVEFKLGEDGEILTRGRHVFKGYYKDPENTAATLTPDGWLHTGDLGVLTESGQIKINGRKKEILKTSGGKMVAPMPIEERLKAAEIISQVCMVGDGRKYFSALITLSETHLSDIKNRGIRLDQPVIEDDSVVSQIKRHIDALNSQLASFEQIKKFAVLSREFTIVDGEMTPTLKVKRNVIEARYRDIIDSMYS